VVTLLLADMSRISESAAVRYAAGRNGSELAGARGHVEDVGRRYLEKIAQIELALPPPDPAAMRAVSSGYSASLRTPPSPADVVKRSVLRRLKPSSLTGLLDVASAVGRHAAERRPAMIRWIERGGWRPAAVLITTAYIVWIVFVPATEGGDPPGWSLAMFYATVLAAVAIGFRPRVLRRVHRRRRKKYERRIQELKDRGDLSEKDIEAEVIADAPPVDLGADRALISDLVSSSFLDSTEFRVVERFVADHPPRLPREGKRMFNHAQLLTEIARARQMFGGDPPLQPEHIAKWIVLRERWPAIGRAVLLAPDLLPELERAAATDHFQTQLDALALKPNDIEELTDLLRDPPQLGALIERLIYFTPAGPSSATLGGSPPTPPPANVSDEIAVQSRS
jgi:hypothetical protein